MHPLSSIAANLSSQAHPKVDPITAEMFFFGYDFRNSCIFYRCVQFLHEKITDANSSVSAKGSISPELRIPLDVPVMMHDFAVTDKHAIFPVLPLTFRVSRMLRGKPIIEFEPGAFAANLNVLSILTDACQQS